MTSMSKNAFDENPERKARVLARTPPGRLGTTREVAEAAYFLVSEASSFISGVVLPVDVGELHQILNILPVLSEEMRVSRMISTLHFNVDCL